MNVLVVGAFDPIEDHKNIAASAAANQVVSEIAESFAEFNHSNPASTFVFSFRPIRAWPRGPLIWSGSAGNGWRCPAFINIPLLRRLIFSVSLLVFALSRRPQVVVSYNPTFAECLALSLARLMRSEMYIVGVIQDVHCSKAELLNLRAVGDLIAMRTIKGFNLLVPISGKISNDFGFNEKKTFIFRGGVTRQGRNLLKASGVDLDPIAVFAGALERHNGIDQLVATWSRIKSKLVLHVFGKGGAEDLVRNAAAHCKTIVYHGYAPEDVVAEIQSRASINFSLRYSLGIDQGYFFPSKLFNLACAPGMVVVNSSFECPQELRRHCIVVSDDLSDLESKLNNVCDASLRNLSRQRRISWLAENAEWKAVAHEAFRRRALEIGNKS